MHFYRARRGSYLLAWAGSRRHASLDAERQIGRAHNEAHLLIECVNG